MIVGELDAKYCAFGHRMREMLPAVRQECVLRAGYTANVEQPAAFERLVLGFLGERRDE